MDAINLPAGVSPDNQDGVFVPGSFRTRPALQRVFNSPFTAGGPSGFIPTVTYCKSFVDPQGNIKNLYLDSNGKLYVEDVTNNPGAYTLLFTTQPGSYAKSITAFGREYIAISDGLHGADIPLQYDGTNLDRYTQDGPGVAPVATSIILPSTNLANPGVLSYPAASAQADTSGGGPPYAYLIVSAETFLGNFNGISIGQIVTNAGSPQPDYNVTGTVANLITDGNGNIIALYISYGGPSHGLVHELAGSIITNGLALSRSLNIATAWTASPHGLQIGYQVSISGTVAQTVGTAVSSIVVSNESNPGLATVHTSSAHGLVPGNFVTITGVPATAVGGGISSLTRSGDQVTVVTSGTHNLSPGSTVTVAGVTPSSFNGTFVVSFVVSPTSFAYVQVDTDTTGTGGTISLQWPIYASATPQFFEVQASPTTTSFQIPISYADGTWGAGGTIQFAWDGTFFVTGIPTAQTFTYQQYGPPGTYSASGSEVVAPFGQAAPGKHQMRVSFLTRQGQVTRPSPPITFFANGGQYVQVSSIPIGPSNVVARIIEFTGANGAFFYYIPVPAQVNGIIVSTATQINDNTTSSILLDFSDNTLFTGLATSIPGNNTANQIVADGALGFISYASRLGTYGQRNKVNNFLAMSFDGGYLASLGLTVPSGWSYVSGGGSGTLVPNGRSGLSQSYAWQINPITLNTPSGILLQSAYLDGYGAPILKPNTLYKVRFWASFTGAYSAGCTVRLSLSGGSFVALADVSLPATAIYPSGAWLEGTFNAKTPNTIPIDTVLGVSGLSSLSSSQSFVVDELSVIYHDSPYIENAAYMSYVNNPEALDALTGVMGPSSDTHKLMDFGIIRNTLYILTQEPSGRLHDTNDSATTEPSGWVVSEVAANCGALSAFSIAKSQADDGTASGGEEWLAWASESGARIFGGDQPWKVSQEIQPNWFDNTAPAATQINMAAAKTVFCMNDPVDRVIYFGIPIGAATAPNLIYPMSYRELDTPSQIFSAPPFHPSLGGRLIATDNTRKWTRWNLAVNGMTRMYRSPGSLQIVLFAGNGQAPGAAAGFGNAYILNSSKYTDDDYGQINSYYVTAFLPTHEQEQALQLDCGRKLLAYLAASISTVGNVIISIYRWESLSSLYPFSCTRNPGSAPAFDLEWGGGNCEAPRMAFKIASAPIAGTDNWFSVTRFIPWFRKSKIMIRGSAQ